MSNIPLLYKLLLKLEKPELRQLKKYLRSPFVTHRADVLHLFNTLADILYRAKPLPSREALFTLVYPDDQYDDQRLRSLMSDLHKLLEQYLRWSVTQRDTIGSQLSLASTYRQRNLPRHFQRAMRKVSKLQTANKTRNEGYYRHELRYQLEMMEFATTNQRTGNFNLQEVDDTLDILYLAQKLRHACTQLSHKAVFQTEYQFGLLQQWISSLENSKYLAVPAVALYYYCYRFLTDTYSQVHFRKFRTTLQQSQQHFPKEELKDLYRAAINFCIRKLNEGSSPYTREGWELFQEGLAAGIFIENGHLSRFTFDNIVGFGLRLQVYEAVEAFINKHRKHLEPIYQESTVYFNYARLEYSRQQYDKALLYIQQSEAKDLVNQLIMKTLVLKIYYESEEFDLLESHLDNFRLFIRRREVSDFHQENFKNIISYTRKLIALAPYDHVERTRLQDHIQQEKILTEKQWLLEKLLA